MPEGPTNGAARLLLKTLLPVYGIIVMMIVGALWYADRENEQQNDARVEQASAFVDEQVADCEDQNQSNEILKQAIDISTAQGGGSTFDLTSIPGYEDLDPATQEWVRGFNDLIAQSGGGGSVTDELKKFAETALKPEDCDQIKADFEKSQAET